MFTYAANGYSLVELVFVIGLMTTVSGMAVPPIMTAMDDYRTSGAARYISTRMYQTRMEAVKRSADVALQFTQTARGIGYAAYVDGNGNGIRTQDIRRGVDRPLGSVERLPDQFAGVDFGVLPGLPSLDGGAPPGTDPIKLGSSNLLSFSAAGTSSSGSVYIRGSSAQYVVRVFGDTGKTRVLKFNVRTNRWNPL